MQYSDLVTHRGQLKKIIKVRNCFTKRRNSNEANRNGYQAEKNSE